MSHLQYYQYPGYGEASQKNLHYSQAVRVGDRIELSGQGMKSLAVSLFIALNNPALHSNSLLLIFYPSPSDPRSLSLIETHLGGWDPETSKISTNLDTQVNQAFANVDLALMQAGGKGWSQVFRVNSYHLPLNDEALNAMVRNFKKYMPAHQPLWTCVGVTRLGYDDMRVEIEVVAHDEDQKAK